MLARCYAKGKGFPQDLALAARYYRKAAKQGHSKAAFQLGSCYALGQGVEEVDWQEALTFWQLAAEQGHAGGQFNLGVAFLHGEGVPQDTIQATVCLKQAADQGHRRALKLLMDIDKISREEPV